jgi:eukaryotic-like serine/threonine-protein kinase
MTAGTPIAGQILGHYCLVEQIGAGGMGVVFRASDRQLERDVAIKVLPPGMLANEAARKRFRHEALALAKVNHPNIGTVFEFGTQEGIDFLVMEYVSGISLNARLVTGSLPRKEVLRLGIQLADGLASAHENGVIHRDLKPANLRLTQDKRLKILDFGLAQFARRVTDLDITSSVSDSQPIAGTLPYMSPEQLRGEPTDLRTDIWSAGAVLYEFATGRRPFTATQVPVLIDSILNKAPEPPSALSPTIPPGLELAILKCLDKDPDRRYQSARELRIDLERLTMPISGVFLPPEPPTAPISIKTSRKLNRAVLISAVAVLLLAVAGLAYWFIAHRSRQEGVIKTLNRRRSVAVLDFKNSTARADSAWLATALPEMLTTELAAGEKLRTITGEEVAHMKMTLALPDSDSLAGPTLGKVGKVLGADLVVLGSYVALPGGQLRLDLHLQNVANGEMLLAVKETGEESNLFDLVSRAGVQLREKCGAGPINPQDQSGVRASLPSTPEASKLYGEGLAKLRVNDGIAARDLLQRAVTADPNHALAHSALAAAWTLLGYDEKARLSAKSAYELSSPLSREDRLLIEARYRETSKEWDNAAANYRTLFGFFPDNIEYGLLLARTQMRGGKGKDSLATVDALRLLPPPDGNDPRIDLVASEAWQALGDFKQGEAFAAQAAAKARAQGTKLILARALYEQGAAFESLNDPINALVAVDEATHTYETVGDRYGLASTTEVTGQVFLDQGDYPKALAKFKDELAIAREVGNRRAESSALNNMALVLQQQGDAEGARKIFEEALVVSREVSDKKNYATELLNIASIMKDAGNLAGARKNYEQTLALSREINNQDGIAMSLTGIATVLDEQGDSQEARKNIEQAISLDLASGQAHASVDKLIDLGDILQHLGDLPDARKNYDQALTLARDAGDKSDAAFALMGLGSLNLQAADLVQARKNYEEALSLRHDLGEKDNSETTQVALAALDLEENHADSAEKLARDASDEFQKENKSDDQLGGSTVLIRALVAEGKRDQAAKEVLKTAPLDAHSENLNAHLDFAIAKAFASSSSEKTPAIATLNQAQAKANKAGYIGKELEIRLAREEILSTDKTAGRSGTSPISHAGLERLQKEAKEKGFDLISRKAATLLD